MHGHGRRLCETPAPQQGGSCKGLSRQGAVASSLAVCAARGDLAAEATVFITNIPGDAGTRQVNYSNYLNLPSGARRFNLSLALNQVSDIDQRILL